MKRMALILLSLAMVAFLAGCGGGEKPAATGKGEAKMELKLASMTPTSHTYNLGAAKFAELVKQRSNGRIDI